jgi:hypothetical protein
MPGVLKAKVDGVWVPVTGVGAGVEPGGATGQILAKASAADYDTAWVDPPSGGGGFGVLSNNEPIQWLRPDGTTIQDVIRLDASHRVTITPPTTGLGSTNEENDRPILRVAGEIQPKPFLFSDGSSYAQVLVDNKGEVGGTTKNSFVTLRAPDSVILTMERTAPGTPAIAWRQNIHSNGSLVIGHLGDNENQWSLALGGSGREVSVGSTFSAGGSIHSGSSLNMPANQYLFGGGQGLIAYSSDGYTDIGGWGGGNIRLTRRTQNWNGIRIESGDFQFPQDVAVQSHSGRWLGYDRSTDGEMLYAYNANCCFNESGGRAWFHRDVSIDGTLYAPNIGGSSRGMAKAWAAVYGQWSWNHWNMWSIQTLGPGQTRFNCPGNDYGVPIVQVTPRSSGVEIYWMWRVIPESGTQFLVETYYAGSLVDMPYMVVVF